MLRKIYSVNKMKWDKKAFSINGIEIKARELIFCITILAVMIFVGLLINGAMEQSKIDKDDQYLSALKVTDKEMFEYGINTNVGDLIVLEEFDSKGYTGRYVNAEITYICDDPEYTKKDYVVPGIKLRLDIGAYL